MNRRRARAFAATAALAALSLIPATPPCAGDCARCNVYGYGGNEILLTSMGRRMMRV
jgi:hypothetical protein